MKKGSDKDNSIVGKSVDILDSAIHVFLDYLDHKYRIEKKAEELKEDAIQSAYMVKRAFIRTIVEAILISTGLLSLIVGLILLVNRHVPIEYVLLGYGLFVIIIVLFGMKTRA